MQLCHHNLEVKNLQQCAWLLATPTIYWQQDNLQLSCDCAEVSVQQTITQYASMRQQQNVNRSGSNTQSSQTLWATSPLLLSTSRYSQTLLEISKVLSDSARAFWGVSESTSRYGGAFRMLGNLTYRIVKFWSSWDLGAHLQETLREAETTAQLCGILQEQLRPRHSSAGDLVRYHHSSGSYITTWHFLLSYSSGTVTRFATSAKCKMVSKSQLNNSATLNSHTDPSRCSQMLPDRLSAKR